MVQTFKSLNSSPRISRMVRDLTLRGYSIWFGKIFRFKLFRLKENTFCETPSQLGIIRSLVPTHVEKSPHKLPPEFCHQ